MILIDTSVWVDHFRHRDPEVERLLTQGDIGLHPFMLGELALGGLPSAGAVFENLLLLEQAPLASPAEALAFIGWAGLAGTGIGYVDAHLLVSARLKPGTTILTLDRKLAAQAERLGLAHRA